MENMEEN